MGIKNWWHNFDGKRSNNGKSMKWCIYGGKHERLFHRGDTTEGQWHCDKCKFHFGHTGIFDWGMVRQGVKREEING